MSHRAALEAAAEALSNLESLDHGVFDTLAEEAQALDALALVRVELERPVGRQWQAVVLDSEIGEYPWTWARQSRAEAKNDAAEAVEYVQSVGTNYQVVLQSRRAVGPWTKEGEDGT